MVLTMRLCVANHTKEHALKLAFSENEAFLFCGLKLFHFRLPPFFRHSFSVNLVPVRIGEVCLPLQLFCVTTGEEVSTRHHGTTTSLSAPAKRAQSTEPRVECLRADPDDSPGARSRVGACGGARQNYNAQLLWRNCRASRVLSRS